jgi:hypothetical protein
MKCCGTSFPGGIFLAGALTLGLAGPAGCHSAFVEARIDNQGPSSVRLIEVDYPSASFGVESIAPHAQFNYRFKIQGYGPLKIEFTDASGNVHDSVGPILTQGQEGRLAIVVSPTSQVSWAPKLTNPK